MSQPCARCGYAPVESPVIVPRFVVKAVWGEGMMRPPEGYVIRDTQTGLVQAGFYVKRVHALYERDVLEKMYQNR